MNKRRTRNDFVPINSKKEFGPASRDSNRHRQVRHGYNAHAESDINFLVHVSSSGTNLNKKIEQEMSKLENVEKKIRGQKYRAGNLGTSNKSPVRNEQKTLKYLLNMLVSNETTNQKPRQKFSNTRKNKVNELEFTKKPPKSKKNLPNNVAIESLVEMCKTKKPLVVSSKAESTKKLASQKNTTKRPSTAPICRVCKFAENLKFSRRMENNLTISELRRILNLHELAEDTKIYMDSRNELKTIVEVASNDNWSQNSSSKKTDLSSTPRTILTTISDNHKTEVNDEKTVELIKSTNNTSRRENVDNMNNPPNNSTKLKPGRKKIYSFLKRGNFTIANHSASITPEQGDKKNRIEDHEIDTMLTEDEPDSKDIEKKIRTDEVPDNTRKISLEQTDDERSNVEILKAYDEIFPTDLLERSILAVEKVLHTIESLANSLNEIKEDEFDEMNANVAVKKVNPQVETDMIRDFKKIINIMDRPREMMTSTIQTIVQKIEKLPPKKHLKNDVLYLKTPIESFFDSENSFVYVKSEQEESLIDTQRMIERVEKLKQNDEEELEPLKKALNALKAKVKDMRKEVNDNDKNTYEYQSVTSAFSFVSIETTKRVHSHQNRTNNRSFIKKLFIESEKSSIISHDDRSYQYSTTFSSNASSISYNHTSNASSNKIFPYCRKEFLRNDRYNTRKDGIENTFRKYSGSERVDTPPEYHFEKCLMLLGKKFKDFDNMRRNRVCNTFHKKVDNAMIIEEYNKCTSECSSSAHVRETNKSNVTCYNNNNEYKVPTQCTRQPNKTILTGNDFPEWIKINRNCICYENKHFQEQNETSCDSSRRNFEEKGDYDVMVENEINEQEIGAKIIHKIFETKSCPK